MRIDHVIYGTADLDGAAARFADEFGLAAARGGRHDGLGTHNQLVPLGDGCFIERDADWHQRSVSGASAGLRWIEVAGDADRLEEWLGGKQLPVRVVNGPPGIWAIGIGDRELRTRRLES